MTNYTQAKHEQLKIYCEHGALTGRLKALQRKGHITVVNFQIDPPPSRNKHIKPHATPSGLEWGDHGTAQTNWEELKFNPESTGHSENFDAIVAIVGYQNLLDCRHVDSAYKSRCICMVTSDSDIYSKADQLFALLNLRIFKSSDEQLYTFLESQRNAP